MAHSISAEGALGPLELLQDRSLLIFDFDGTLADTSPLHALAFNQVLAPFGVRVDYPAIAGMKTRDALEMVARQNALRLESRRLEELTAAKQRLVRRLIEDRLVALPGVAEFLSWVRPRYRMALYSSGSRGTLGLSLEKLGYSRWFDPLICGDDVTAAKPDPEGYHKVLQLSGVAPGRALVFEDSDAGLRAAARAGIATVDVRPPFDYSFILRLPPEQVPAAGYQWQP
ncbi:fructose-1-phosphate/6-phosphogluconate phosphatase [Geomonas silvestris]|uniref:Fructose-1-phosphate/6-phosphogluconate phosphatase n=1 Tax=Geomonas silvestris TaxID=2740184 RepID=A0A6V8MH99_9BACT|nr:HAD family phosphatase [Geomonas silvestris]GFO59337.1 fructose-1-phosphate/6-phosphogluconate phosphatase [Geomonas silvestris]